MNMTEESLLTPGQQITPHMDEEIAKKLVESRYDLHIKSITELNAYDDKNYHIKCKDQVSENPYVEEIHKDGYVLKVLNSLDSNNIGFIEAQNELLIYLNNKGIKCPMPVKQKNGTFYSIESLGSPEKTQRHIVRLFVYRTGEVLSNFPNCKNLYEKIGFFAADLDIAAEGFSHPALETHNSLWHLKALPNLREFLFAVEDKGDKDLIEKIITSFEDTVLSKTEQFDSGIIHGDLNADNIVVDDTGDHLEAVIDFGDSHKTCLIFELAICLCYMLVHSENLEIVKKVVEGYEKKRPLNKMEKKVLKCCVCARLVQSIVIGTYSYKNEPNNHYLAFKHEEKWKMLKKLWNTDEDVVLDMWGLKDNVE